MRTGFRIGQGVVMSGQVEAADGGHGLQLVVGQATAVMTSRGGQRVVEEITGIIHPVNPEDCFETTLVETCIMGNEWDRAQPFVQARGLLLLRRLIGKEHIRQAFF